MIRLPKGSVHNLPQRYRDKVWVIQGRERASDEVLTILGTGGTLEKRYLSNLLFSDNPEEVYAEKVWVWRIASLVKKYHPDLLIRTTTSDLKNLHFDTTNGFFVPRWIYGEIVLDVAFEQMKKSVNVKKDLARVRKNELEYEVTRDPQRFDEFYHQMCVPYLTAIYGDLKLLVSHDEMKEKLDQAELMLIKRNGEYLAGEILLFEQDGVRAWTLGVKDGDFAYVKMGVLAALYYYKALYLSEKGYAKMNVGSSRPFLNDGVLQYKKKWGMRLAKVRRGGMYLKALSRSAAIERFLINNPFVYLQDDELFGAVFTHCGERTSAFDFEKIAKSYYFSGMKRLNVFCLDELRDGDRIPSAQKEKVAVLTADSFFSDEL